MKRAAIIIGVVTALVVGTSFSKKSSSSRVAGTEKGANQVGITSDFTKDPVSQF